MQAWLIDGTDGIDKLRMDEVADPRPAPGKVLLDVLYAALNPADRYLAEGQYPAKPAFPHILGRDGVGIVRELGPQVSGLRVGEPYTILRGEAGVSQPGTFSQKVVVPAEILVPVPPGWTLQEAACAALVYVTAYQALTQWPDLPEKSVVLITGASGGVGVAATQLAAAIGHRVIALSRSEQKRHQLRSLGAALALDPASDNWPRSLRDFLGAAKVDLVIDNIGGDLFNRILGTLGNNGRISCVGCLAGPVPDFNTATLFFRRIKIGGVAIGSYTNEENRAAWTDVLALMNRANAKPLIDRVYPFGDLQKAFDRLAEGPMGKVLVKLGAE